MTNLPTRKSWGKPISLLILAAILAGLAVVWYLQMPAVLLSDPVAVRVSELAREANGALENENFPVGKDEQGRLRFGLPEAITRYEEILRLKPFEELPYRNLAIAKLIARRLATQSDGEQAGDSDKLVIDPEQAKQELVSAAEEYLSRFETPVAQYLHGEILRDLGTGTNQLVEKVEKFFAAAQAEPDHVPFWYLSFWDSHEILGAASLAETVADLESLKNINSKALSELRRLRPENLFVIRQSLVAMIQSQDPQTLDYWRQKREVLEKAGFSTKNYVGPETYYGDYSAEFEQLDAALQQKDWSLATSIMSGLDNSIKGKLPAVNDLAELQPNPLDYLLWQFSDELTQAAHRQVPPPTELNSIKFSQIDLGAEINGAVVRDFGLADVDFDGHLDLFVLRDDGVAIFKGPISEKSSPRLLQIPSAGRFSKIQVGFLLTVGERSGSGVRRMVLEASEHPAGISQVELPQIVLTGDDGMVVYGMEWTAEAGYSAKLIPQPDSLVSVGKIQKSLVVDFDQDADLDVVVIADGRLQLLMNRGNNTFVDASHWLYVPSDLGSIIDIQMVDWNRDLYIDLLVQSADGKLGMFDNERHGAFRYRLLDAPQSAEQVGFTIAEFDGNASWDLVANVGDQTVVQFTETKAWSRVQWLAESPGVPANTGELAVDGQLIGRWQVGDFDNSTTQDLLLWKDGQLHFYPTTWVGTELAQGAPRLTVGSATAAVALSARPSQGERGDFDGDGDLDLVVLCEGRLELVKNDGGNKNPWLAVVPLGLGDNMSRTNHLGIGSLMEARIGPHYFAETVTRPVVHIGLGTYDRPNLARIIWTNGIPQTLLLPQGRQTVEMLYILKGSCPFIYTWDGKQWQFLSDCLWAAPIGLQASGGGLVPTRNWEYLRLGPDVLTPTDGTYRVMLTEELWEVAYFDHVRLLAVDHPAEIEVHINDKVGPPEIVQHRLYRVGDKTFPVAATNQLGQDVLPLLREQDHRFVKSFSKRWTQGYVEPHDLILDFGATDLEHQTLFLTGWIQPTDTSINVMLQQQPELPGPQFPSLFVIGADGQWQAASRPMGFPGGKTKTMAVPLEGLFPTSDQRLKITSSAEIYWDQVYVAQDQEDQMLQQHEAKLLAANMFFRGTSRRMPLTENGPETFDARDIATEAVWPPVSGSLTPYGSVLDLLTTQDNRLAVLGTGDAVELRFEVPTAPLPTGHRRTFLLYTVGYDKDSDLHTYEGQRVEPLPTNEMESYPDYAATQRTIGTAERREQNWYRFWRQIQNPQMDVTPEETKVPRGDYRRP